MNSTFKLSAAAFVLSIASICSHAGVDSSAGGSRFYYDTLKFQALLSNSEIEIALRSVGGLTLDGIKMQSINETNRTIQYQIQSGNCALNAVLSWDDGFDPNYRVTSISKALCKKAK